MICKPAIMVSNSTGHLGDNLSHCPPHTVPLVSFVAGKLYHLSFLSSLSPSTSVTAGVSYHEDFPHWVAALSLSPQTQHEDDIEKPYGSSLAVKGVLEDFSHDSPDIESVLVMLRCNYDEQEG